jgi:hypothetical protein
MYYLTRNSTEAMQIFSWISWTGAESPPLGEAVVCNQELTATSQVWWWIPVIPAWQAETVALQVWSQPELYSKTSSKKTKTKRNSSNQKGWHRFAGTEEQMKDSTSGKSLTSW